MQSWEVLREAIEAIGVKSVASRLKVSSALVYKWCQEPPASRNLGSGARNPLDRIGVLIDMTHDPRLVNWLCQHAGGFFSANPEVTLGERDEELLGTTQQVVHDFSALLTEISQSIENDGVISPGEAERIRQSWEVLKSHVERFAVACEKGVYQKQAQR